MTYQQLNEYQLKKELVKFFCSSASNNDTSFLFDNKDNCHLRLVVDNSLKI